MGEYVRVRVHRGGYVCARRRVRHRGSLRALEELDEVGRGVGQLALPGLRLAPRRLAVEQHLERPPRSLCSSCAVRYAVTLSQLPDLLLKCRHKRPPRDVLLLLLPEPLLALCQLPGGCELRLPLGQLFRQLRNERVPLGQLLLHFGELFKCPSLFVMQTSGASQSLEPLLVHGISPELLAELSLDFLVILVSAVTGRPLLEALCSQSPHFLRHSGALAAAVFHK